MRVRMGSQGPLTPCPAPSGRRSPPRDQKEGAGAARPADRPSFSGLVGGPAAAGDSSSSSAAGPRAHPAWRRAHQGGVKRGSARPGMGRVGMQSLWEDVVAVAELRGAPWVLLQAGGGSVAPEGAAVAAAGLAGCRYGAARPVLGRLRPAGSAWSPSSPALRLPPPASRPSASRGPGGRATIDDRKKAQKRRERSKAALPAETQLKKRGGFM